MPERGISQRTLAHYEAGAEAFWAGTRTHDVSQNIAAMLRAIEPAAPKPWRVLDFGCGPGRDLVTLRDMGIAAVGLEGSARFVAMAREHSGCEVLQQDFLSLSLPAQSFAAVFANASLFHVPGEHIRRVLRELRASLKAGGVLFASNPRGRDEEGWSGGRYGVWYRDETWLALVAGCGFVELEHYYRPQGLPLDAQPWLASVWRKPADAAATEDNTAGVAGTTP